MSKLTEEQKELIEELRELDRDLTINYNIKDSIVASSRMKPEILKLVDFRKNFLLDNIKTIEVELGLNDGN